MGHSGRYEIKYVVNQTKALAIAEFVSHYLRPSAHNNSSPVRGHPVISLYLDSPDLTFFRQGFSGDRNRTKLRIRIYDNHWNRPAFLEIKRRVGDVIVKERAMITREGVRQMLTRFGGQKLFLPDYTCLIKGKKRADVLNHFVELGNHYSARGVMFVSYVREIFEAPDDDELRLTLDRHIRGTLYNGNGKLIVPPRGVVPNLRYYNSNDVVLELKFDGRFPVWMNHLVKTFDLERRSVCKYCACVDAMGLQWGKPLYAEREIPWSYQTNE
jgi:hypothetical protein